MKSFSAAATAVAGAALLIKSAYADVDPIVISVWLRPLIVTQNGADIVCFQGSKFFYKTNGTQL